MKNELKSDEIEKAVQPSKAQPSPSGDQPISKGTVTQREASARYNKSVRDSGGRILTLRLRNTKASEALARLVREHSFSSETAAATWVLERALMTHMSRVTEGLETDIQQNIK